MASSSNYIHFENIQADGNALKSFEKKNVINWLIHTDLNIQEYFP